MAAATTALQPAVKRSLSLCLGLGCFCPQERLVFCSKIIRNSLLSQASLVDPSPEIIRAKLGIILAHERRQHDHHLPWLYLCCISCCSLVRERIKDQINEDFIIKTDQLGEAALHPWLERGNVDSDQ